MASGKKMMAEPGYPLVLGANRLWNGVNFAVEVSHGVEASLILYKKKSRKPFMEIPFTEEYRSGNVYAVLIPDFQEEEYEYNFRIDDKVCQDPCAYAIKGRERFGAPFEEDEHRVRCGFLSTAPYDWQGDKAPEISYSDLILYKVHVRGYTKANKDISKNKGTFAALKEMIPYWKELGINAVELMPAYEFKEVSPAEKNSGMVSVKGKEGLVNYWGYGDGFYFSPKSSYCASSMQEVKDFVKELHSAGIECIMEMFFPKKTNPVIALRALQFWKLYYHIDGFHILGEGAPVKMILPDGVLQGSKLMIDGVDGSEVNGQSAGKYVAEYNQGFLQDMRRFLKSDEDMVPSVINRIKRNPDSFAVVNYMASQDGFTLNDVVTYNEKHNEDNGENNQDGNNYNFSWNCGVEGPSRKQSIRLIRERQIRNAFLLMLLSQGVPMIYGGDEIANSQGGNNNAYCQDNAIGWIDWKGMKKNAELLEFVKKAIAFRKEHPILHMDRAFKGSDYLAKGFPDFSVHGERAWFSNSENTSRLLGIMYCGAYGKKADGQEDDMMYVGYNFHWENRELALPNLPKNMVWKKVIDTADTENNGFPAETEVTYQKKTGISPRSVVVLTAKQEG